VVPTQVEGDPILLGVGAVVEVLGIEILDEGIEGGGEVRGHRRKRLKSERLAGQKVGADRCGN
jgi:hypothetical protein